MKTDKKIKLTALASGTIFLGSLGATSGNALAAGGFNDLGSASELRSTILGIDALNSFTSNTDMEFECGEGKCGEGKCGGKDKKAVKESKSGGKTSEKKSSGKTATESKSTVNEKKKTESDGKSGQQKSTDLKEAPKN